MLLAIIKDILNLYGFLGDYPASSQDFDALIILPQHAVITGHFILKAVL